MASDLANQLEEVKTKIKNVDTAYQNLSDADKADLVQRLQTQLVYLEAQRNTLERIPHDVLRARAAERARTEQIQASKKASDELAAFIEKSLAAYAGLAAKNAEEAKPIRQQKADLLLTTGGQNFDESSLDKHIDGLKANPDRTDEENTRLQTLLATKTTLFDLNEKIAESDEKAAEADAEHEYAIARLNAELEGNQKKLAQLEAEEKLRRRIKELSEKNASNPEAKAREEIGKQTKIDDKGKAAKIADFEKDFSSEMTRLIAEATGDKDTVAKLDHQKRVEKLTQKGIDSILSPEEARKKAEERANAEEDAKKDKTAKTVADTDRRVGLGGIAFKDPAKNAQRDQNRKTELLTTAINNNAKAQTKLAESLRNLSPVFAP